MRFLKILPLLFLVSSAYAQVLPYTDVNSTNTVTLSNKTITSAANTLTIDCNVSTCNNFPLGGSAGNPTAKVGTAAVNGVLGTYMRSDAAPAIDLTFSPTWTGTHTFNGTVAGTALSTYLASPPGIGGSAPAAGSFTTLAASSTVSGTGFSTYLASPPAIGGSAAAAGSFTTLSASGTVSGAGFSTYLASPPAIGGTAPAAGSFTTLTSSSGMALSSLALQATNTVVGNATSGSAVPTALSVGGCSSSTSALIWTTNTGFGCNTSINAATLGGATFSAPGAIGGGTAAAGNFTTLGVSALLTASLGATISGADTNIEASSNFNTNVNTGTSTGTVTLGQNGATPSAVAIKGPVSFQAGTAFSAASWLTVSPVFNGLAMTLNDTTASGPVATDAAYSLQQPNFTSTGGASTTITSAINLWLAAPTCTTVVCTNKYALFSNGQALFAGAITGQAGMGVTGASVSLNNNSNFSVNIGTGSNNAALHIGDGTGNNTIGIGNGTGVVTFASPVTMSNATVKLTGITTGTNADTVCLKADGTLLIQAAACTISSLRFKTDVRNLDDSAIPEISNMRVVSFRMKNGSTNRDPNAASTQTGLIAENIATVAPECAIYESDMKTPKSYRQECVIALLVKGEQELVEQNAMLKARIEQLEAH